MTNYKLSEKSLKKLKGIHPDLQRVVKRAIEITTQDFIVHEGLRTVDKQKNLVASGASRTVNSKHLQQADGYGHAVDLLPWADFDGNGTGEISWHWDHYYPIAEAMRQAAQELGIIICWGGCWGKLNGTDASTKDLVSAYVSVRRKMGKQAFIDGPHFELVLP